MMHSNSAPKDGQKGSGMRPVSVPRPSRPQATTKAPRATTPAPKAATPVSKAAAAVAKGAVAVPRASAPPQSGVIRKGPSAPPPAPKRPPAKPSKATPPPLPETLLLTDADLVDDEDTAPAVRDAQPTAVDVELDCFTCTEPPPESRPRRKRALLACVTGLVLVTATGWLFLARPVASQALRLLNAEGSTAARAPAMLSVTALSAPASSAIVSKSPSQAGNSATAASAASNAGPRANLSAQSKRGKSAVVGAKKPNKANRSQHALRAAAKH